MARYKELATQLAIVTAGVFIALFVDSLVDWNQHRRLVNEARATIAREIAYNKKEIESALASVGPQMTQYDTALRFADEMEKTGKTQLQEVKLDLNMADLSLAGWQSAERTGALAYMDYGEVQELSKLYGWQELVAQQQRRALDRVSQASGLLREGPGAEYIRTADYQSFREHVMALRADVGMFEQFAKRLVEFYDGMLARPR